MTVSLSTEINRKGPSHCLDDVRYRSTDDQTGSSLSLSDDSFALGPPVWRSAKEMQYLDCCVFTSLRAASIVV